MFFSYLMGKCPIKFLTGVQGTALLEKNAVRLLQSGLNEAILHSVFQERKTTMTGKFIVFTAMSFLLSAAHAAPVQTGKSSEQRSAQTEAAASKKVSSQDSEKVKTLQEQRRELIIKIQKTRMELLKKDPKLRRMHLQLIKQTRELALELDANREMRALNDALFELEQKLEREQKKK